MILKSVILSDLQRRSTLDVPQRCKLLTASMYYVVAKIQGYTLLDADMLPLQGEHWQTDQMVSAYLTLVASRFSRPGKLVLALDFMVVGSIFTGLGIKAIWNKTPSFR